MVSTIAGSASWKNNMKPLNIAVLGGTTRVKRESDKVARYIATYGSSLPDIEVTYVDPAEFSFPDDGNDNADHNQAGGKDPRYSAITAAADAFFIIVPEYNHSFPGSLKRMLDSELQTYNHKPVALAGVSSGAWGGVRGVESLVPAVRETGLVVLSWDIYFPHVQDMFDDAGSIRAEHKQRYDRNLGKLYDELIWMAKLLRSGRTD